jgi:hypothetical protein
MGPILAEPKRWNSGILEFWIEVFTEVTNPRRFPQILIEIVQAGHVKQRKI